MSADEEMSADSNLSNDGDSFGGSSSKGVVLKKGPWTTSEDAVLVDYVKRHGEGNWNSVQKHSVLSRCGKSCRLRWANHLRPNLKKGAFTPEEEWLIIELHAKMGNKWARMAAHLPGRTDNEIKNYWNTRIKRRNRAGLPLYPSELCLQPQPENQHHLNLPGIFSGDKGYNNIFETSSYEKPGIIFNSPNTLPYPQVFPNITTNGSLIKSFASPQFYSFASQTVQLHKHTQELDELMSDYKPQNDFHKNKAFQSVNLGCSYDPSKILSPNVNQDIRFMSNSLFSVSTPFEGAEKLELPSIQYQRNGLGVWNPAPEPLDSLLQSHLSEPLVSRCESPQSSCLLESLLYESKDLKKSDNTFLDNSVGSVSDGFTHTSTIESSFEEKMPARHHVKSDAIDESWMADGERQEISEQFDFSRPDAVLGSCWLEQSASCSKPRGSTNGTIEALPFEDLGSDSDLSVRTSASDSSWGFNSCSWNNMPPVCQMSGFP